MGVYNPLYYTIKECRLSRKTVHFPRLLGGPSAMTVPPEERRAGGAFVPLQSRVQSLGKELVRE